jgi:hypothetical protein
MADPLGVAFTKALAEPAGIVPAVYAEDYATELAAIARRALATGLASYNPDCGLPLAPNDRP